MHWNPEIINLFLYCCVAPVETRPEIDILYIYVQKQDRENLVVFIASKLNPSSHQLHTNFQTSIPSSLHKTLSIWHINSSPLSDCLQSAVLLFLL